MFVSYAQNLEDVMLWRALRDVERGFYIDVGAGHPVEDSVTKAFYERGWRGINVEPLEEHHRALVVERPEDTNLNVALGETSGEIVFYEVSGAGLSTTREEIAHMHAAGGHEVHMRLVPCTTLDAVCREHRIEKVHFLKIDVEGSERAVLAGSSLEQVRPWVVVVEATLPNSPRESHQEWESLLLERGYEFVYFDGLNRFYVARERAELKERFAAPPNFFDHYVPYPQLHANQELEQTRHRLQELENELTGLQRQLQERATRAEMLESEVTGLQGELRERATRAEMLESEVTGLQGELRERATRMEALESEVSRLRDELHGVYHSRSWRLTAPLRAVMGGVRSARPVVGGAPRQAAHWLRHGALRVLRPPIRLALRSPILKRLGARLLATRPELKARLLRLTHPGTAAPEHLRFGSPGKPGAGLATELPESARDIYRELQARLATSRART